jgi:hypothetical protein
MFVSLFVARSPQKGVWPVATYTPEPIEDVNRGKKKPLGISFSV